MISVSSPSPVESRIAVLKLLMVAFAPGRVQELTGDSAEIVYFIPHGALREAGWNRLRVRLAHASRQQF